MDLDLLEFGIRRRTKEGEAERAGWKGRMHEAGYGPRTGEKIGACERERNLYRSRDI